VSLIREPVSPAGTPPPARVSLSIGLASEPFS
jgi:hypothetical protein